MIQIAKMILLQDVYDARNPSKARIATSIIKKDKELQYVVGLGYGELRAKFKA